MMKSVFEGN